MANWDESKHPRDDDGKFGSGGGGAGANRKTKSERATESFKRRMDEEGEVAELNELEVKYLKLAGGNPFDLSPEAEKALSDFNKKKADLQKRGIIEERIRGAKPGEGFRHKSTTDEMKRRTPANMGDGRSSWTEEERKKFSDPTSHLKFVKLGINADVCFGSAVALNWEAPEDGSTQVKVQLSPFGEFTLHDGGKRNGTVQHCSKAAFEALVANWKAAGSPDVLVDVDHASARGGSTEAAAWCNSLEVDDNGLQGVFNLTPKGLELVKNRSYRFVSPGWTLSPDGTPVSLCSVALTNRPNLPVKPVVNADETGGRDPDDPNPRKDNPEMDIKKLAAALGLPETATEEEVLAAIKAMQDREAQAAAEAANAKAEEFADNAVKAGKIAANSKEAVKAAYLKSPEVAQEMLNSVAAPAPAAKLPDFTAAKQPTALNARTPGKDADPVEVYNAYMAMPEGADKDAYLAANAQAISDGYEKAHNK